MIKWEEQLGAASYELEISIPDGTPIVFKTDQTSFALYLEIFRWGGQYLWKASAFTESLEMICATELFSFTKLEPQKKPGGGNESGDGGGGDGSGDDPGTEWEPGSQWNQ